MEQPKSGTTATNQRPKRHEPPALPEIDLNLSGDEAIAHFVADTKLYAMRNAFSDRYNQGIDVFLQGKGLKPDARLGRQIADCLLEERRQVLIRVVGRSVLYATPAWLAAIVVGIHPLPATAVIFPSTIAAVCIAGVKP